MFMEPKFQISEVLKKSWRAALSQIWVLAGLVIGMALLSFIISIFTTPANNSTIGLVIVQVISLIIGAIFSLGYLKNIFQTLDGDEPQFSAYGSQSRKVLTYIASNIIVGVIVLVGLVFLIIPGIYLYLRLQFFTACIVEEDCGPIEAIKRSWQITEGQIIPLLLLMLTQIGLYLLGIILFVVGVFVAYPVCACMYADVYRKLTTRRSIDINEFIVTE